MSKHSFDLSQFFVANVMAKLIISISNLLSRLLASLQLIFWTIFLIYCQK